MKNEKTSINIKARFVRTVVTMLFNADLDFEVKQPTETNVNFVVSVAQEHSGKLFQIHENAINKVLK